MIFWIYHNGVGGFSGEVDKECTWKRAGFKCTCLYIIVAVTS